MTNQIALKSLNQYRKRDIIAYLSLRYYLDSKSSRTDFWAKEVAVDITLKSNEPSFFKVKHFKGVINSELKFREIYIPSANDIISESVLITECSKYSSFHSNSAVYSYFLNDNCDSSIYKHYTDGLNKRFLSIHQACRNKENEEVVYLDIKSFYPSINLTSIEKTWLEVCNDSNIPNLYKELGQSFIDKYKIVQKDIINPGLLIGPMFSHLLANLYLKEVDITMKDITSNRYWRYVDDIVITGNKEEIDFFLQKLYENMSKLGLTFHDQSKFFKLTTKEWIKNKSGVDNGLSWKWVKLIGLIKKLAILAPEEIQNLKYEFNEIEVRLAVLDYCREVKSKSLSSKLFRWLKRNLKRNSVPKVEYIISYVENIRYDYFTLFTESIKMEFSNELENKTKITRIKYLVGRLIYLSREKELIYIANKIIEIPELLIQYEIIKTILTKDISKIVKLGTNATQAVSQVIKQKELILTCTLDKTDNDVIIALAIFKFHGIKIEFTKTTEIKNPFYDFASGNIESSLGSDDKYLIEFASLHGRNESRHEEMLNSLFDENEILSFDVLNAESGSNYYF